MMQKGKVLRINHGLRLNNTVLKRVTSLIFIVSTPLFGQVGIYYCYPNLNLIAFSDLD